MYQLKDFFQMTRMKLLSLGLGFILAGFLTLIFPYLLIGVVVTVLFGIGAFLLYLAWKVKSMEPKDGETIIIEKKDDFFEV